MNVISPPPFASRFGTSDVTAPGNGGALISAAALHGAVARSNALRSNQGVLRDIGGLAGKAGGAVRKIKAPAANKAVVEALRAHLVDVGVEGGEPALERLGVILAEAAHVVTLQPRGFDVRLEHFRRGQHAARKNVLLDEVAGLPVLLETIIGNRDGLNTGARARFQRFPQRAKIGRPVTFADGLEHFDGCNAVELAGNIAVILYTELDMRVQARRRNALQLV